MPTVPYLLPFYLTQDCLGVSADNSTWRRQDVALQPRCSGSHFNFLSQTLQPLLVVSKLSEIIFAAILGSWLVIHFLITTDFFFPRKRKKQHGLFLDLGEGESSKGNKSDEEEDGDAGESRNTHINENEERKKEDALWASFLSDVAQKPKAVSAVQTPCNQKHKVRGKLSLGHHCSKQKGKLPLRFVPNRYVLSPKNMIGFQQISNQRSL